MGATARGVVYLACSDGLLGFNERLLDTAALKEVLVEIAHKKGANIIFLQVFLIHDDDYWDFSVFENLPNFV